MAVNKRSLLESADKEKFEKAVPKIRSVIEKCSKTYQKNLKKEEAKAKKELGSDKYDKVRKEAQELCVSELKKVKIKIIVPDEPDESFYAKSVEMVYGLVSSVIGGIFKLLSNGQSLDSLKPEEFGARGKILLSICVTIANEVLLDSITSVFKKAPAEALNMLAVFVAPFTEETAKQMASRVSQSSGISYGWTFSLFEMGIYLVNTLGIFFQYGIKAYAKVFFLRIAAVVMHMSTTYIHAYSNKDGVSKEKRATLFIASMLIHAFYNYFMVKNDQQIDSWVKGKRIGQLEQPTFNRLMSNKNCLNYSKENDIMNFKRLRQIRNELSMLLEAENASAGADISSVDGLVNSAPIEGLKDPENSQANQSEVQTVTHKVTENTEDPGWWEKVKKWFKEVWETLKALPGKIGAWFKKAYDQAEATVKEWYGKIKNAFDGLWTRLQEAWKKIYNSDPKSPGWIQKQTKDDWIKFAIIAAVMFVLVAVAIFALSNRNLFDKVWTQFKSGVSKLGGEIKKAFGKRSVGDVCKGLWSIVALPCKLMIDTVKSTGLTGLKSCLYSAVILMGVAAGVIVYSSEAFSSEKTSRLSWGW